MTITLRIVLLVASVLNCVWIILRIRKAQAKIEDSVFWILFSGLLVCMSIFPPGHHMGSGSYRRVFPGQLCVFCDYFCADCKAVPAVH